MWSGWGCDSTRRSIRPIPLRRRTGPPRGRPGRTIRSPRRPRRSGRCTRRGASTSAASPCPTSRKVTRRSVWPRCISRRAPIAAARRRRPGPPPAASAAGPAGRRHQDQQRAQPEQRRLGRPGPISGTTGAQARNPPAIQSAAAASAPASSSGTHPSTGWIAPEDAPRQAERQRTQLERRDQQQVSQRRRPGRSRRSGGHRAARSRGTRPRWPPHPAPPSAPSGGRTAGLRRFVPSQARATTASAITPANESWNEMSTSRSGAPTATPPPRRRSRWPPRAAAGSPPPRRPAPPIRPPGRWRPLRP